MLKLKFLLKFIEIFNEVNFWFKKNKKKLNNHKFYLTFIIKNIKISTETFVHYAY